MRELRPADVQSHKPGLFPRIRWSPNTRKEVLQPNATATNDSPMELGFDLDRDQRLILKRIDDSKDGSLGSRTRLLRSAESDCSCLKVVLGNVDMRTRIGGDFVDFGTFLTEDAGDSTCGNCEGDSIVILLFELDELRQREHQQTITT